MRIGILGLFVVGFALQGCSTNGTVERDLIIASAPVACAGDPPDTCLQASEPNGDKWLMRFDEIEGFTYEPGFTYEVEVAEPPLNQELGIVPRLALIRVVSKEPAGGVASPLGDGAWQLQSLSGAEQDWAGSKITASFHGGGWVDGFAGCNTYLAGLTVEGQKITISTPTSTPDPCTKAERAFLVALAKAQSYSLDGDALEITLSDGGVMRFKAAG